MFDCKTSFGEYKNCSLRVARYVADDRVAILITSPTEGPIADITVCLDEKHLMAKNKMCSFVDTNNCPWAPELIEELELGDALNVEKASGWCTYPMYEFDESKLREHASEWLFD